MALHPDAAMFVNAYKDKLIYMPYDYKAGGKWLLLLETETVGKENLYAELNCDSINSLIHEFFLKPENGVGTELSSSELTNIRNFSKNHLMAQVASLKAVFLVATKT